MKKALALTLVLILGIAGLAQAQSIKEVYLAVKKAQLKATGTNEDIDNSIADARAEFDLFKDSKTAKKNPQFTDHIEAAIMALRQAQFAREVTNEADLWTKYMHKAETELNIAKQFIE
ncbi:MAG: hypothetical protein WAK96_10440 [Desulfobaccales bacterium]